MDSCLGRPVRILYVGQMIARKGVRVVVDAVARLRGGGLDVELELVGTGEPDYVKELERQVEDRGLAGRVRFAGYVHDVRELLGHYRGADVFAIGTMAEGFPRVVYEAMTQGLPVVATGIGTISAMVRDGEEAVLVTPGDSAAMAEGLERVIRDAELRRRLIRNGYAFARACFGPERPSAQIMALIHQYGRP
jgi:glycosyltransferase involved in cell wall biosynthesis